MHGGTIYLAGQVADDLNADITTQARQVLSRIDRLLAEAGSGKDRMLSATIYLPDMADFAAMNAVWEAWIVPAHPPARATVQARLDRLVRRGVIETFAPTLDPEALGFTVTAFATLEIRQGRGSQVLDHLRGIPEVLEVHTITGQGDMLCRVVARSNDDLQRVLNRLNEFEEIVRSSTVIALSNPIEHRVLPLVAPHTEG